MVGRHNAVPRSAALSRHWHGSFVDLPVGTVLIPQPGYEQRWTDLLAAKVLEDLRPSGCRAHRDSVFTCVDQQDVDNCGGHTEWLFEVEPIGPTERHDLTWTTRIEIRLSSGRAPDDPEIVQLAARYWSGAPTEEPVWEHLSGSATILSSERF
jgi:hypothetical protein